MNRFLQAQISTMIISASTFRQACELAALKDDGMIDRKEKKELDRIAKATDRFLKELKSIK